jgi:PAS domain S-box-containing protein
MIVDTPLMILFTILVLAGGISFGLLYRHMHDREEDLGNRAQGSEENLRALLTMTDDAVLIMDSVGAIRAVNPAAEELFGRSEEDFVGEEITQLLEHPLQLAELTRHGPANFDALALRPFGENLRVEVLLSQVQHGHGISYMALVHEKHTAAAATPVPAAPDLVAQVCKHSHDLNNQLTGIIGHLSLILMSAQTDPAVHERIVGAKRNTLRAQEINRKLQATAKGEKLDPSTSGDPAPGTIVPMPVTPLATATTAADGAPRVLVLDDEEAICALVTSALGALGMEVTEAAGGDRALQACEQAKKNGRPFHLVIADLSLGDGANGIDVVARLHQIDPNLKAVVSTGYDQDPIMNDFRRHGFEAALAKPYELNKLGRVVRDILEASGSASRKSA